jgi:uncharacterized membrane protein YtjA (UPF0391 family)
MLKRAGNWVLVALVAALFGFTGILHWTAGIAQSVFFICTAFGVFSLLLSLFEEPSPRSRKIRVQSLIR